VIVIMAANASFVAEELEKGIGGGTHGPALLQVYSTLRLQVVPAVIHSCKRPLTIQLQQFIT